MIGRTLGHYEIIELLGAGGMGEVYRARDLKLGRDVALKVLPGDFANDPSRLARFEREAKLLASLNHPNIASIHGLEEDDGVRFIAMELVRGESLAERLAHSGPLQIGTALEIAGQIAEALDAAHDAGIVHRDIKPANVLLTRDGGVKVLDFGIAKSVEQGLLGDSTAQPTTLTTEGSVLGTPSYMSPEQIRGRGVDERTDVWAVGCVLYEMLTGSRVFAAETPSDTLADILKKEPDWSALPATTPSSVRALLERSLCKEPDRRLRDAREARVQLTSAQATLSGRHDRGAEGRPAVRQATALLLVALALVAGWYLFGRSDTSRPAAGPGPDGQIRSLVVLPLKNLMNDPDQTYFVEGMHEALITELSKIEELRVISRTSAMQYQDSPKPVPQIGRELGVDAVIEGSVLRAGNVVRISAQLIEASSDSHIWAQNFDRELDDILALYAEVTREIADQIRVTANPDLVSTRPVDPEVYDLYLRGRHLCGNWSPQEMQDGITLLERAVELDPEHAGAHAQLTMCLIDTVFFDYLTPMEIDARARAAASTAVEIDDRLAEAHVALGSVSWYLGFDRAAAEREYRRALEIDPNSIDALIRMTWLLSEVGRPEEALETAMRARELDPLSKTLENAIGQIHYLGRDFDRAMAAYQAAVDLDRSDPSLHYYLAGPYEQKGEYPQAIELYETAIDLSDGARLYVAALGHLYGSAGMRDRAQGILDRLQEQPNPSPYNQALVHLGLGEHTRAIELLERAYDARNFQMVYLYRDPRFDPLRDDERFARLLQRFGW